MAAGKQNKEKFYHFQDNSLEKQKQVWAPHFQWPQGREGELQRETRTPVGQAGKGGASGPLPPLVARLARVHLWFTASGVVMKKGDRVPLN